MREEMRQANGMGERGGKGELRRGFVDVEGEI